MIDKPEAMERPPKREAPIISVPETRDCLVMALAWECPFCKKMNGIPEIDVCKCGARRIGAKAVK